jgi:hypothetical protein
VELNHEKHTNTWYKEQSVSSRKEALLYPGVWSVVAHLELGAPIIRSRRSALLNGREHAGHDHHVARRASIAGSSDRGLVKARGERMKCAQCTKIASDKVKSRIFQKMYDKLLSIPLASDAERLEILAKALKALKAVEK